jgi:23S rRNA pseudouridine1911/1915/1917 synthase
MVDDGKARWVVDAELDGNRLDKAVSVLGSLSRSVARSLIEQGRVTLDGVVSAPAMRVARGAVVTAELPDVAQGLEAVDGVEFRVAWEDDDLLVVDKPAGLVVHPGAGHHGDTLANGLLHRYPQLGELGEEHRWGIVHRIDRTTSGLLVVAKTAPAHESLQSALRRREVSRLYWALAWGSFDATTGTIDAPIGRHPAQPTKMAVVNDGRAARSHYTRLASWIQPELTLLEVALETGRTHQIRVHLASIKHPVVGDRTYGRAGPPDVDPGRVWLHARVLSFPHPRTAEVVTVQSDVPDDLRAGLTRLGPPPDGEVPLG